MTNATPYAIFSDALRGMEETIDQLTPDEIRDAQDDSEFQETLKTVLAHLERLDSRPDGKADLKPEEHKRNSPGLPRDYNRPA